MNELPPQWFADNYGFSAPVDYDRWPGSGPARHVVIAEGLAIASHRAGRPSCRAVFHRLARSAASIAIAALWSAVTLYAISLWVVS